MTHRSELGRRGKGTKRIKQRKKGDKGQRDSYALNLNRSFAFVGFIMPVTQSSSGLSRRHFLLWYVVSRVFVKLPPCSKNILKIENVYPPSARTR